MEYIGRKLQQLRQTTSPSEPPPEPSRVASVPLVTAASSNSMSSAAPEEDPFSFAAFHNPHMLFSIPSYWTQSSTSSDETELGASGEEPGNSFALKNLWRRKQPADSAEEAEPKDEESKVKGKLKAAWNNVKYGWAWKQSSSFHEEAPIWLLGKMYRSARYEDDEDLEGFDVLERVEGELDYEDFFADFFSRIWFTYRVGFTKLDGSGSGSDCGWGCMIRSGQMLAAQALMMQLLGRDWTLFQPQTSIDRSIHRDIIRCFGDTLDCPLSLHQIVRNAESRHGKSAGDWFGPGATAHLLKDLFNSFPNHPLLSKLSIHVARDCAIALDEVCKDWSKSLLLIIPLRLGASRLNPVYIPHLKTVLALKSCVGIMGGKPKHSMFFLGWHGNNLIYLDPHFCQDYQDTDTPAFPLKSFHCQWPRKLEFVDMDPSCAVGFFCRNQTEFSNLLNDLKEIVDMGGGPRTRQPLFSVVQSLDSNSDQCAMKLSNASHFDKVDALKHGFELL